MDWYVTLGKNCTIPFVGLGRLPQDTMLQTGAFPDHCGELEFSQSLVLSPFML
jgi:hypothetical protein